MITIIELLCVGTVGYIVYKKIKRIKYVCNPRNWVKNVKNTSK